MTVVFFVRHAHSPWVANQEAERGLSERGRQDAERVADILSNRAVDAVVSSPYVRSIETVRPIAVARDLTIVIENEFRERRLTDGPVETIGETFESATTETWQHWEFAWPGGESNHDAQRRGVDAFERMLARYDRVVIGTHGTLLTLMLNHYNEQFDFAFWKQQLTTPDIYRARFDEGELREIDRLYEP